MKDKEEFKQQEELIVKNLKQKPTVGIQFGSFMSRGFEEFTGKKTKKLLPKFMRSNSSEGSSIDKNYTAMLNSNLKSLIIEWFEKCKGGDPDLIELHALIEEHTERVNMKQSQKQNIEQRKKIEGVRKIAKELQSLTMYL